MIDFPASRHHAHGDQDDIQRDYGVDPSYYRLRGKGACVGRDTRKLGGPLQLTTILVLQLMGVDPGMQTCLARKADGIFENFLGFLDLILVATRPS